MSRSGAPPLRLERPAPKAEGPKAEGPKAEGPKAEPDPFEEKTPPDGATPRLESVTGHAEVGEGFDDDIHTSLDAHVAEGRAQSLSKPAPAPRPKRRPIVDLEGEPGEQADGPADPDEKPRFRLAVPESAPSRAQDVDSPLAQIAALAQPGALENAKRARESRFKFRRLPDGSEAPLLSRRDAIAVAALLIAVLAVWGMDRSRAGRRIIEGPASLLSHRAADPPARPDETVYKEAPKPPPPAADFVPMPKSRATVGEIPALPEPVVVDLEALEERERALSDAYAAKMGTHKEDAPPAEETGTVRKLSVKSSPAGAVVLVRGDRVGVTPLETEVRGDGPLQVSIQAEGRKPWSAQVPPNSRGQYVIDAQLPSL